MSKQPLESLEDLGFKRKAFVVCRIFDYSIQPVRIREEYGWLKIIDVVKDAVYINVGERYLKIENCDSIDEILIPSESGQFIDPSRALLFGLVAFITYNLIIFGLLFGFLPAYLVPTIIIGLLSWGYVWYTTPSFEVILEHKSYEKGLDPRIVFEVVVPTVTLRHGYIKQKLLLIEKQIERLRQIPKLIDSAGAAYDKIDLLYSTLKKNIEDILNEAKKNIGMDLATEHAALKSAFEEQKEALDTIVDIDFERRVADTLRRYGVLSNVYRYDRLGFDKKLFYLLAGILIGVIALIVIFRGA